MNNDMKINNIPYKINNPFRSNSQHKKKNRTYYNKNNNSQIESDYKTNILNESDLRNRN